MASCCNCSAPLPTNTPRCRYCGTRNDMDFVAMKRFAVSREECNRQCPHCQIRLHTVRLTQDGAFVIERCDTCYGLFFDPGEVQAFLQSSVARAHEINYKEISNINQERFKANRQFRYIKCPECGKVMNRINFGYRSGVVLDQCKDHGVWLDNGELIHLMEWKKAGGQLLDEQVKTRRAEEKQRKARATADSKSGSGAIYFDTRMDNASDDLVQTAFSFVSKFFS